MSANPGSTRPVVAHVVREYLGRTQTFIYSTLRAHTRFEPVVLAARTENLEEFPLNRVFGLLDRPGAWPAPVHRRFQAELGHDLAERPATLSQRAALVALAQRVAGAARQAQCVILHAHFGYAGTSAVWARRRLRVPLVTTFYGWDIGLGRSDPRWRPRYRKLFAAGDVFVCEGPAMAQQLVEIGCPPERIRIVKIGIELERFPFAPPKRGSPLIVMQAARFIEKKGVDLSIRAYAAALAQLGDSELWLIGDGPLQVELKRLTRELDVSEHVRFLGALSYRAYAQALEQVNIGLQPSRTATNGDTEGGAPTVLLELQARGIPVLATRHADIPEVVAASDELVDEEDVEGLSERLLGLANLSEPDWLLRAEEGRALVECNHAIERTSGALERVYTEALGR